LEQLLAKRLSQIATEIGVPSKVVLEKCRAEGIPESQVKGHMSTVSAGLEATIREWFSASANVTAVETSQKVDLDAVRVKPKRAAKKKVQDTPAPEDETPTPSGIAVAEPPEKPAPRRAPHQPQQAPDLQPSEAIHIAPPPLERTPPAPQPSEPPPPVEPPRTQPPPAPEEVVPARPAAERPRKTQAAPPVKPAPMNVPVRPKVVTPAGPLLQGQAPVRLMGPKVVRVEAPEATAPPRPRRTTNNEGQTIAVSRGPRGGTGVPVADDDRGRSPRRGATGGAAAAANKRRTAGAGVPDRRKGRSGEDWVGTGPGIFSEQDLIEREARLMRAGGFLKKRRQDLKRQEGMPAERAAMPAEIGGKVQIAAPFTIKDLSAATGVKGADIVKKLFLQGIVTTINAGIDPEKAQEIMLEYNIELEVTEAKTAEETVEEFGQRQAMDERPRGPVVTILGHVDHGKTSLLDRIRNTNVAAGEAGGITQATSAFRVQVKVGDDAKYIVFLDTPGHQAFTAMRARGAQMTDVVVLVVSAPEGVMPQTIESINHAKAAGVPIVVALNKIDRPDATEAAIQKTLGQLAEAGLNPVQWGGDTEVIKTSATTGQGVQELLETLDYQAQLLNLTSDFGGHARGTVIEARMEEGRGCVANVLVQDGMLRVGDFIVAGRSFGRVRDLTDDRGTKLKEATPPMPVQISGLDELPDAGDRFYVVDSLKQAQEAAEQRRHREREQQLAQPKVTLDSLFSQMGDKGVKEIRVVIKADVQGSVDVLRNEVERVGTAEVKVRALHAAVGGITESDVLLADASKAVIIGFNVIPSGKARQLAEQKGVEIRTYQVIYDITDDLRKAAEGMLAPELRQEILGHAEVRKVFKVSKVGAVAGCYVTDGVVQRDALIRVTRNDVVVENDRRLEQLKRHKDDAREVRAGMECGMKIAAYDDIKEGDILECYRQVEVKRTL
jgi:translation initiation factor IF-2